MKGSIERAIVVMVEAFPLQTSTSLTEYLKVLQNMGFVG
jgi:hypothetical protein